MNLHLLRHGLAVERGTKGFSNDAERPLTEKGRRKLKREAAAMHALDLSFDLILSSPLIRAQDTAKIIAKSLDCEERLKFTDLLAPGADPRDLIRYLRNLKPSPEDLMLVGHEPDLSRLISLLLTGDDHLELKMKKGGICRLTTPGLRASKCASLEWLLTPGQLETMV